MSRGSQDPKSPLLRAPEPFGDLHVNFCRNPACENYGVPASPFPSRAGHNDPYKIQKGGKRLPDRDMVCKSCGREFRLKSNRAVAAEIARISRYMKPEPEPCWVVPRGVVYERRPSERLGLDQAATAGSL